MAVKIASANRSVDDDLVLLTAWLREGGARYFSEARSS
jgi:hypothetical protein